MNLTIAVDAMGGDDAPAVVLAGTERAVLRHSNVSVILFGDQEILSAELKKHPDLAKVARIQHTDEVVKSDDAPGQALRHGRDSSMGLAIKAVAEGEADVVISAGNTGALMAMSRFLMKTMPGIDRPALATSLPTMTDRFCVILDLGANVDCTAENLVQFAIMGEAWSRVVFNVERPGVGLLNIGVEAVKGNETVKAAEAVLSAASLPMNFLGYVEGDDITKGEIDVVVTDGYSGNIALKTLEGTVRLVVHTVREAFRATWYTRLSAVLSKPALERMRKYIDPGRYNGAVMLGLNGLVVKSHGNADAAGYAAAVEVAISMADGDLIAKIAEDLSDMTTDDGEARKVAIH